MRNENPIIGLAERVGGAGIRALDIVTRPFMPASGLPKGASMREPVSKLPEQAGNPTMIMPSDNMPHIEK